MKEGYMVSENIFLELSKKVQNLGFKQSLIEISKIAFDGMNINRLTVWKFHDHFLSCQFKYQDGISDFDCNFSFNLNEYPSYTKALLEQRTVVANDVYNSQFTYEFYDHFQKENIKSILQIPIYVDGVQYGMVFFGKTRKYHTWTKEDIKFGGDVSQVISIAYISSKRNEDIRKLNEYADRIKTFNEELQEVIRKKNEQFIEYGFINSHLLNAPLSRLKGLMNILVLELNGQNREEEIKFIIDRIYESYDEMDNVVSQISALVDKGADIDRDDITL